MKIYPLALLLAALCGCGNKSGGVETATGAGSQTQPIAATWPRFNADSAYEYIGRQVAFGPRVPGTYAHDRCRDYIASAMTAFGADTVIMQNADVKAFDGTILPMTNILARFNTAARRRILLAAHYDTRPWADEDPDPSKRKTPIDGANDGGSGVGVLMEIARNISHEKPEIGVDFLFTDVEDYGAGGDDEDPESETSWCLGSSYWAENPYYTADNRPSFGILLDMVGGRGARFYREHFSEAFASWVNGKIWKAAKDEGIVRFVDERRGAVTDDHLFINRSRIPCVDIIECANPETGSFPPYWHTTADNMAKIDTATLGEVGRTIMRVIYTEKN